MKQRLLMILAGALLSFATALAQGVIKGTVVHADDGEPIVGASVTLSGTTQGAITDVDGNFSVAAKAGQKLDVSYVGMITRKVTAKDGMRVALSPDATQLDEVMVVAFGTAKKSAFTGSATVVGTKELEKAQVTSVTNALQGQVAGVQLTSANGDPSATSTIRIRGFSSLNAGKDPLIIVDGAPYSGDLTNLNTSDVESMTVLKDAASNALYGARGANGVIMITTKSAKRGKDAVVTLDAKIGWNTRALQHYKTIKDPRQYYEMQYQALVNRYTDDGLSANDAWLKANQNICGQSADGGVGYNIWTVPEGQMLIGQNGKLNPLATMGRIVSYRGEDYLMQADNWEDEGTRTGVRQEYNLSINGGSDKGTFYASMGYLNNEGITEKSDFERFTGRLRADYQAKKWLKIGANLSFAHYKANSLKDNGKSNSTGNIWAFTSQIAPIYPAYLRNPDGSVKVDVNGIRMMDYGNGKNGGMTRPFISDANPIQDNLLNTTFRDGNAASANGFMDVDIIKGLRLTINGTYNLDETRYTWVYNPYYGQFDTTGGTVEKEHYRTYNYNLQQLLNYTTTIAKVHNVQAMVGHEYYNSLSYDLSASRSKMYSQSNLELGGAVVDGKSAFSSRDRYNVEGYFGRVQYDYDNRIFGSVSFRRDASSRFAPENRWGNFWSVGAAWIISKEKFMDSTKSWLDMLKVKASVGSQGNDNIASYRYTDTYNIENSNGEVGTSFRSKGTRDITWETNTNVNVGVEFQMFKRLTGSLEFYHRKTTDMLYSFSVAPSLGYSSYMDNVGDMYNSGFELTLGYNAVKTKNINWDINFNIASLRNRITYLDPQKKTSSFFDKNHKEYKGYQNGSFFITEDQPMYTWILFDYAGVNDKGESLWYKDAYEEIKDESGKVTDKKFTGRETTTDINEADRYVTRQSTVPKFYGGFGTSVEAYGFDFSINCSFSLGGKQFDSTYASLMGSPTESGMGYAFHKDLLNAWSADNVKSNIPRFQFGDLYSAYSSTRFLTNASYLNIENINCGYTLPREWTKKLQIEKLRLYFSAENVGYFSKRRGFDPRQAYDDMSDASNYSPMRTLSVGMNVTF